MSTVNLSVIRTDTSTPPTMQSQDGVDRGKFCLAWGNIMIDHDGHPLCTKGFNVAAIEDIGTGRFVIHFSNPLPSANYAVAGMVAGTATGTNTWLHGTTAGYKVTVAVPQTNLGMPAYEDSDGITMLSLPFNALPTGSGNNECSLLFT